MEAAVASALGAAACGVALDDEPLVVLGLLAAAGGKLAHQGRSVQLIGLAGVVAGLAGSLAYLGGLDGLGDDGLGDVLVLEVLQPVGQLLGDNAFHSGADFTVAQAALGLALKLRVLDHCSRHAGEALAEVLAGEVVVLVLQCADAAGIVVEHLGEGGLEAGFVAAALAGGDVVDVGEHRLSVAVGVLDGHAADDGILRALEVDGLLVHGVFAVVEVLDVVDDAAVVLENLLLVLALDTFIHEDDPQSAVEVRQLLQAAGNGFAVELHVLEDGVIVYSNATILGRITIGENAVIGANVWITQDVAPDAKVSFVKS